MSPAPSSSGSIPDSPTEPLYQVKLLAALRSGDLALIQPLLTEISRDRRRTSESSTDLGAAALHLAIRCASSDTIQLLLQNRYISPNAVYPPESKTTPLHLAATLGRAEIVSLLLDQDGINDTSRDAKGLTPKDVANGKAVRDIIQDSQSLFRATFISILRTYILSPSAAPPPPSLLEHLSSSRVSLLDLSYLDDASGTTLLHEAARRKDLRLVELAVRAGADVFVRDRRGRPVTDAAGKDDRVKAFLRQFTNEDRTLIDTPLTESPTLKGYLNKYTNVARGYNTRWFVLKDGMLSYYRHQEDENLTCRGSISMKSAVLKVSQGSEKLRFEVQSTPNQRTDVHNATPALRSSVQKWYMKANHPAEVARWTQAIKKSIEWYQTHGSSINAVLGVSFENRSGSGSGSISDASSNRARTKSGKHSRRGSLESSTEDAPERSEAEAVSKDADFDMVEDRSEAQSYRTGSSAHPPHADTIGLRGHTTAAQLELTGRLVSSLTLPSDSPPQLQHVVDALRDSLAQVQGLMGEYMRMSKEREDWYRERLDSERDRATVWEESLSVVVREGEVLERELRKRERARPRRRSTLEASDTGTLTLRQKKPQRALPSLPDLPAGPEVSQDGKLAPVPAGQPPPHPNRPTKAAPPIISLPAVPLALNAAPMAPPEDDMDEDDDEDEFFDAIESNNLPNLIVSDTLKSAKFVLPRFDRPTLESTTPEAYVGYRHLRERLPIDNDNRPSTSLWQVLKGSIGKDLTKITFPVYFNEPTSMLQRMAEDMEFSECLDAAVAESDPHKRIAFVAAFAMSNYSSTIGRIAKPFNPMLGETFEYARLDKHYRYYSEQVSHHPPVSACWAESPEWRYYGEVDAQNKFMGKSFEIRPTGVAHAELKVPKEAAVNTRLGQKYEHYTWKKVTTNVSGFILGSTTIDHYGEMIVINHRTQDTCVLTFKPRGWRGKDAFEISGRVMDAMGHVIYDIAGRWNNQLVARRAETGRGDLLPDINVDGPASPSAPEYILLWRNTEKPPAPFNLTPYAVTLNDCPADTLRPYLPPTDCRLRPDQRAFEMGRYERANELKSKQEDFQRATRRKREEGILPPHKPRWFEAKTDGDTGERVWAPMRSGERIEYWEERERVFRSEAKEVWKDVDHIFIEDMP